MIHVYQGNDNAQAYSNVSGFTTSDLGITHKKGFPTLIQKAEYPDSKAYLDYFNQVWENEEDLKDVTEKVEIL